MNYIIVEVFLPAANKPFDIKISKNSMMWEVVKLVSSALEELSDGMYKASEDSILCNRDTGTIYNINLSIEELGLLDGSRLILI